MSLRSPLPWPTTAVLPVKLQNQIVIELDVLMELSRLGMRLRGASTSNLVSTCFPEVRGYTKMTIVSSGTPVT